MNSHGGSGGTKIKFIALAVLFMLPVVAAMVLYRMDWRPRGTSNHGELIQPARPIADVALQAWDGKPVNFSSVAKKWTMLYFASAECGRGCEQALYKMRQVHLAQGRERDRLQSALAEAGIATGIHYPVPVHAQPAYTGSRVAEEDLPLATSLAHEVLSLPVGPHLGDAAVDLVVRAVLSAAGSRA